MDLENEIENIIDIEVRPICKHWVDCDDINDLRKAIKELAIKYAKSI